jgi:thiosulfate dehydrogenase
MTSRTRLAFLVAAACVAGTALAQDKSAPSDWTVPDIQTLPDDKFGRLVRLGKDLVVNTQKYVGPEVADPAMRYAGNNLACTSCHVDGGTKKFGNPFVGTFADYPQYRPREDGIQTIEDRVNGCMERSMAGKALPTSGQEMRAIVAYMKFMSTGVPVGREVVGRGVPKVGFPDRAADPVKGKVVYEQTCQACHGEDGAGKRAGATGDALGYLFPPLWGPDSYSNGAGMARVIMAARFIKGNMPKGVTHEAPVLSDEQALDVAAFINSQKRPEKARLDVDFPNRRNKPVDAAFAPYRAGFTAEQHKYGPFKPIIQARERDLAATPAQPPKAAASAATVAAH